MKTKMVVLMVLFLGFFSILSVLTLHFCGEAHQTALMHLLQMLTILTIFNTALILASMAAKVILKWIGVPIIVGLVLFASSSRADLPSLKLPCGQNRLTFPPVEPGNYFTHDVSTNSWSWNAYTGPAQFDPPSSNDWQGFPFANCWRYQFSRFTSVCTNGWTDSANAIDSLQVHLEWTTNFIQWSVAVFTKQVWISQDQSGDEVNYEEILLDPLNQVLCTNTGAWTDYSEVLSNSSWGIWPEKLNLVPRRPTAGGRCFYRLALETNMNAGVAAAELQYGLSNSSSEITGGAQSAQEIGVSPPPQPQQASPLGVIPVVIFFAIFVLVIGWIVWKVIKGIEKIFVPANNNPPPPNPNANNPDGSNTNQVPVRVVQVL